ncbi:MAG: hypothetical protein SFV54_02155 [Bryobacteraceae bacterium]|nr:hypothetical protein [Bryobacteraceae bacterium]
MEQIPCPDGYLLDAKSALAEGHHALDQYLMRVDEAGWQAAIKEVNGVRDKRKKLLIWKALLERFAWHAQHSPENRYASELRGLSERIEKWTLAPTAQDLIEILESTAAGSAFAAPYTPVVHVLHYIEEHGHTPQLAMAVRQFRDKTWDLGYSVNQTSLQLFRSRLDMLAWRDEWSEIDLKRCWSDRVRSDFRAMSGAERENWRRLLHSIRGDETGRPAPKWIPESQKIVAAMGADAFCRRLLVWFEPLKPGATQKLSREGSFILRSLVWLAGSVGETALLDCLRSISEVEFKPKNNGEKVRRAAAEAVGRPDPTVRPPGNLPTFPEIVGRSISAALGSMNLASDRVAVAGDVIHIRGQRDTYELHIGSRTVYRGSDGKQMEIPMAGSNVLPGGVADLVGLSELVRVVLALSEDSDR